MYGGGGEVCRPRRVCVRTHACARYLVWQHAHARARTHTHTHVLCVRALSRSYPPPLPHVCARTITWSGNHMCVRACMCVRTRVRTRAAASVCARHTQASVRAHVCVRESTYVRRPQPRPHTGPRARTSARAHASVRARMCTCVCTRVCARVSAHAREHTARAHTHTPGHLRAAAARRCAPRADTRVCE